MLWFPVACCSSLPFLGNSSSPLFISGSYLETRLSRSKLPLLNASGFSQCPRNGRFAQKRKKIYYHHDVLSMSFNEGRVAGIVVQLVNNISPSWLVTLHTVKPSIFPICMHAAWALLASCLLQLSGKCFGSLTPILIKVSSAALGKWRKQGISWEFFSQGFWVPPVRKHSSIHDSCSDSCDRSSWVMW